MEENYGALFGYNYRRRILINLRNRKKRLREKYLIMVRNQKTEEERKKREAIAVNTFIGQEKEKEVLLIHDYEEAVIENKLELAEVLKEGLIILIQELKIIYGMEKDKGINDDIKTKDLIKELEEDINNLSFIKDDKRITPEEEGIIKDILYDNSIERIIEEKKRNLGIAIDKRTLTNWIEFDREVDIYDSFIKDTIEELQVIDHQLDNKLIKEEDIKDTIDKGFKKSYKVLMTLAIATKKENPIDRIVSINMALSLMRDIVNPNIQVKNYNTYSIRDYTKEIERCYIDPSYCRLFIIDSRRKTYEISKELKKQRNSLEYGNLYKQLSSIIKELDNQEYELMNIIKGKEKETGKVYIKEMEDYE